MLAKPGDQKEQAKPRGIPKSNKSGVFSSKQSLSEKTVMLSNRNIALTTAKSLC